MVAVVGSRWRGGGGGVWWQLAVVVNPLPRTSMVNRARKEESNGEPAECHSTILHFTSAYNKSTVLWRNQEETTMHKRKRLPESYCH